MRQYKTLTACLEALGRGVVVDQRDNGVPAHVVRRLAAYSGCISEAQERRLQTAYGFKFWRGQIMQQDRFAPGESHPIAWFWWTGEAS